MDTLAFNATRDKHCCSQQDAWAWVDEIAEAVLAGEVGAWLLPAAIDHALGAERCLTDAEAEIVWAWVLHCQEGHDRAICPYCLEAAPGQ